MDKNKPYFLKLSRDEQKLALEALIFASDEALNENSFFKVLLLNDKMTDKNENPDEQIDDAIDQITIEKELIRQFDLPDNFFPELIDEINYDLVESNRPYKIKKIAGGYQFSTREEYGQVIQKYIKLRLKRKFSQAALETLSIIAYRQPVTKPEVEQVRGVNSVEVINNLVDRNLVKIIGRKDSLGKPLLYGTTPDFLRVFGLNSLSDLPRLREFDELADGSSFDGSTKEQFTLQPLEMEEPSDEKLISENDTVVIEEIEEKNTDQENNIAE